MAARTAAADLPHAPHMVPPEADGDLGLESFPLFQRELHDGRVLWGSGVVEGGAGAHGPAQAPRTGEALADLVQGTPSTVPPDFHSPHRFD